MFHVLPASTFNSLLAGRYTVGSEPTVIISQCEYRTKPPTSSLSVCILLLIPNTREREREEADHPRRF